MKPTDPICVKCHQPVHKNRDSYEVFEKMHWLCFHFEFEHEGDADMPCNDPGCPWWHLEVFKAKLTALGIKPEDLLSETIKKRWG